MRTCKYSTLKYKSFFYIYKLCLDDVWKKGSRLYLDGKNEPTKKHRDKKGKIGFLADEKEIIKHFMGLKIRKNKK